MIEVEAKTKLSKLFELRNKIENIARFHGREKKVDDYYTLEKLDHYPRKSLRIRKRKGHHEINFKQRIFYKNGIHAKHESEFIVKDIRPFLDLIADFGFKKWLRKEKYSEIYEINKKFHIELNKLKNLGWFLEIEYLCQLSELNYAKKEIEKVLKRLDIPRKMLIKDGYTKILWKKWRE